MPGGTVPTIRVLPLTETDRPWANALLTERWGSTRMVTRGAVHDLTQLPGLVAWYGATARACCSTGQPERNGKSSRSTARWPDTA